MSKSQPMSIRASNETQDKFNMLVANTGKKSGEFLSDLLENYQSTQVGGSQEIKTVADSMKLILDTFKGVQSNARLSEENLKSAYEAQIAGLEAEKVKALSKARDAIENNAILKEKLQATEGMAETVKTLNAEIQHKNSEIEKLSKMLDGYTELSEKVAILDKEIVKISTENRLLNERLVEYRELLKIRKDDNV